MANRLWNRSLEGEFEIEQPGFRGRVRNFADGGAGLTREELEARNKANGNVGNPGSEEGSDAEARLLAPDEAIMTSEGMVELKDRLAKEDAPSPQPVAPLQSVSYTLQDVAPDRPNLYDWEDDEPSSDPVPDTASSSGSIHDIPEDLLDTVLEDLRKSDIVQKPHIQEPVSTDSSLYEPETEVTRQPIALPAASTETSVQAEDPEFSRLAPEAADTPVSGEDDLFLRTVGVVLDVAARQSGRAAPSQNVPSVSPVPVMEQVGPLAAEPLPEALSEPVQIVDEVITDEVDDAGPIDFVITEEPEDSHTPDPLEAEVVDTAEGADDEKGAQNNSPELPPPPTPRRKFGRLAVAATMVVASVVGFALVTRSGDEPESALTVPSEQAGATPPSLAPTTVAPTTAPAAEKPADQERYAFVPDWVPQNLAKYKLYIVEELQSAWDKGVIGGQEFNLLNDGDNKPETTGDRYVAYDMILKIATILEKSSDPALHKYGMMGVSPAAAKPFLTALGITDYDPADPKKSILVGSARFAWSMNKSREDLKEVLNDPAASPLIKRKKTLERAMKYYGSDDSISNYLVEHIWENDQRWLWP